MITPRSPSSGSSEAIVSAQIRMTLNVPVRLTSITPRKSSSGMERTRPTTAMPAQLTATRSAAIPCTARWTSTGLVISPSTKRACSARATAGPFEAGRSSIVTFAPAAASDAAVARPNPEAPPVTKASASLRRMNSNRLVGERPAGIRDRHCTNVVFGEPAGSEERIEVGDDIVIAATTVETKLVDLAYVVAQHDL